MTASALGPISKHRWLRRGFWTLAAVAGAGGVVAGIVVVFGLVTGEEFCPQTFQRRNFWLVEVPLVHWPLTGERRQDRTGQCEQELARRLWIVPAPGGTTQWHLAWQRRGGRRQTDDAYLLLRYLDSRDADGELRWLVWSQEHPALAQRLWPAVQQLALKGQYLWIPDLFLLARQHSDAVRFDQAVQAWLAQAAAAAGSLRDGAAPGDGTAGLPAQASADQATRPAAPASEHSQPVRESAPPAPAGQGGPAG